MDYVTSGPIVAIELMRVDAIKKWRQLLGPTDPLVARADFPMSIRAKYGKDVTKNAAHGSDSTESAERVRLHFIGTGWKQHLHIKITSRITTRDAGWSQ